MSLADRSQHFRKEFPSAKINPTLLRKVYRMHHIKKKKIRWYKTPTESDTRKTRQKLGTMKMLLTRAKNQGYRIVYIDETMITRKAVP